MWIYDRTNLSWSLFGSFVRDGCVIQLQEKKIENSFSCFLIHFFRSPLDAEPICDNWAKSAPLCYWKQKSFGMRFKGKYHTLFAFWVHLERISERIFKHFIVNYYDKWINRSNCIRYAFVTSSLRESVISCSSSRISSFVFLCMQWHRNSISIPISLDA